ncbi:hypothetical protein, partial [uncultured Mobiluncus sp.]|uniref:hypothetical protein n=1 Tax=uncultured Mobiluncus sp. TaxID=293425 RepID=UPI0028053E7B
AKLARAAAKNGEAVKKRPQLVVSGETPQTPPSPSARDSNPRFTGAGGSERSSQEPPRKTVKPLRNDHNWSFQAKHHKHHPRLVQSSLITVISHLMKS